MEIRLEVSSFSPFVPCVDANYPFAEERLQFRTLDKRGEPSFIFGRTRSRYYQPLTLPKRWAPCTGPSERDGQTDWGGGVRRGARPQSPPSRGGHGDGRRSSQHTAGRETSRSREGPVERESQPLPGSSVNGLGSPWFISTATGTEMSKPMGARAN